MPTHDVTGSSQERATEDAYVMARKLAEREQLLRDIIDVGDPASPKGVDYPALFGAIERAKIALDRESG